jgi:hypothetical protein
MCAFALATGAVPQNATPSLDEIRALADRAIANQHRNDAAQETYERIERHVSRSAGRTIDDKTYRVVPTGTGTLKLLLKDNGKTTDAAAYRADLRAWERTLEQAVQPDADMKFLLAKAERKRKDRAALVDAVRQAYRATWLGRETINRRVLAKIALEPNPQYQPPSSTAEILTHMSATLWIDEKSGQLARAEANVIRDIYVGLGVLGKVNRGGHFTLEQQEVAPNVWLPVHLEYTVTGRKLFFSFTSNQVYETSAYRDLGPPSRAIEVARKDLANPSAALADP